MSSTRSRRRRRRRVVSINVSVDGGSVAERDARQRERRPRRAVGIAAPREQLRGQRVGVLRALDGAGRDHVAGDVLGERERVRGVVGRAAPADRCGARAATPARDGSRRRACRSAATRRARRAIKRTASAATALARARTRKQSENGDARASSVGGRSGVSAPMTALRSSRCRTPECRSRRRRG